MNAVVHTTETKDNAEPVVRDTATVTVQKPVDGTKKRRRKSATNRRRAVTTTLSLDDVDPRVREAALQVRKPGQVLHVVSPTEVLVRNR